jgi:hypothetical protein
MRVVEEQPEGMRDWSNGDLVPFGAAFAGTFLWVTPDTCVVFEEGDVEVDLTDQYIPSTPVPRQMRRLKKERLAILLLLPPSKNAHRYGQYIPGVGIRYPELAIIHGGER